MQTHIRTEYIDLNQQTRSSSAENLRHASFVFWVRVWGWWMHEQSDGWIIYERNDSHMPCLTNQKLKFLLLTTWKHLLKSSTHPQHPFRVWINRRWISNPLFQKKNSRDVSLVRRRRRGALPSATRRGDHYWASSNAGLRQRFSSRPFLDDCTVAMASHQKTLWQAFRVPTDEMGIERQVKWNVKHWR